MWRFDFEDGRVPPGFTSGKIVELGANQASRYALQGGYGKYAPQVRSVVYQPQNEPIVRYEADLILRFRVYLSTPHSRVRLQVYDFSQRQNYQYDVVDLVADRWNEKTISLDELQPVRDTVRHLEPGDDISVIYLMGGVLDGADFAVDDFTLLRKAGR